jgi:hypothetical protein
MNPDKRATALAIIKAEYAEYGHKTKRSVQVVVENGIKRKARNRVILEGLKIYEKRQRGYFFGCEEGDIK